MTSRRGFLLGAGAATLTAGSLTKIWRDRAYPDNYCEIQEQATKRDPFKPTPGTADNPLKILETLGRETITMWGDTNHTDARINAMIFNQETIDGIASAGIKHVVLEQPPEVKDFLETLDAQGKQSSLPHNYPAAQHLLKYNSKAGQYLALYKACKDKGIDIHCVDDYQDAIPDNLTRRTFKARDNIMNEIKELCGNNISGITETQTKSYFARHPLESVRVGMAERFITKARSDDREKVRRIKEATNGEKTLIIYGAAHLEPTKNRLGALLKADTYCLYPDKAAYDRDKTKPTVAQSFIIDDNIMLAPQTHQPKHRTKPPSSPAQ